MDLQYQLKSGSYYLYDMGDAPSVATGERRWRLKTDNVAIAFDVSTGTLHQHGSPARIQSWALGARRRLRADGAQEAANDIVVVSGPLPIEEINRCLKIRGYSRKLLSRLSNMPNGKFQNSKKTPPHH